MNISPHSSNLPIATVVNPPTDALRRENTVREVIAQPAAASQSASEKGVASDKDKSKTPGQNSEAIDFIHLRKQAEESSTIIGDSAGKSADSSSEDNAASFSDAEESEEAKSSIKGEDEGNKHTELVEEKELRSLQKRDREVRAHEQAHASTGASTGAPSFTYQVGPDGKKYAVGGEISIDISKVGGDPRATINKMQQVYTAALAPLNPSSQDLRVAASASRVILEAQSEIIANELLEEEDVEKKSEQVTVTGASSEVLEESDSYADSHDFDALINQTLLSQEDIVASQIHGRTNEVSQRAIRIENHYLQINQAYEKPPSHHFQIMA